MSTVATVERADCLIWSGEHGAYWGPDRCGYFESSRYAGRYTRAEAESILQAYRGGYFESSKYAGRYTRAEAESILQACGPGKRLAILPAPEYEDEWEALAESLSKHFAQRATEYLVEERALVDILRALRVYSQEMKDAIRRLEAPSD